MYNIIYNNRNIYYGEWKIRFQHYVIFQCNQLQYMYFEGDNVEL